MIKGGYKIVDLNGIELDENPYLFTGLRDNLLKTNDKPVLLTNVVINNESFDYYVQPIIDENNNVICTIGDNTLTVTVNDYVTLEEGIVGGGSGGSTYIAGNGIDISDNTISVSYDSETAASEGETLSLVTTGEKYIYENKSNICKLDLFIITTSTFYSDIRSLTIGNSVTWDSTIEPDAVTFSKNVVGSTNGTLNNFDVVIYRDYEGYTRIFGLNICPMRIGDTGQINIRFNIFSTVDSGYVYEVTGTLNNNNVLNSFKFKRLI